MAGYAGGGAPARGAPARSPINAPVARPGPSAQNYHYAQIEERKKREEDAKAKLIAERQAREAGARQDYERQQREKQRKAERDVQRAKEVAAQKKDDDARAHRAKMDAIDKRL